MLLLQNVFLNLLEPMRRMCRFYLFAAGVTGDGYPVIVIVMMLDFIIVGLPFSSRKS